MDPFDSDSADPLSSSPRSGPTPKSNEVVCRIKPTLWFIVPLGFIEASFMLAIPFFRDDSRPGQHLWRLAFVSWPMGITMAWGSLWMLSDLLRGEIRADAAGLSWRRGFKGWKSARWDDIADYYLKGRGAVHYIETLVGKLELSSAFLGIERIIAFVPERARHLKQSGWERQDLRRDQEWSHTFSPWSNEQKWGSLFLAGFMAAGGCFLIAFLVIVALQDRNSDGFWFDIFPCIIAFALFGPVTGAAFWMSAMIWRTRNFAWQHREEKLILDAHGLIFSSPHQNWNATWDEVQCVTFLAREEGMTPVQVETTSGNFIVWKGTNMEMWNQVRPILALYAPQALQDQIADSKRSEVELNDIEGERGTRKNGVARWSFRYRPTRFLFQCVTGVGPFAPLMYLVGTYMHTKAEVPPSPSWPLLIVPYFLYGAIVIAGWSWYWRAEILADEETLEIRSAFLRPRKVTWSDIDEFSHDAWGEFVRAKGHKTYVIGHIPPVRVEELRDLVRSKVEKR